MKVAEQTVRIAGTEGEEKKKYGLFVLLSSVVQQRKGLTSDEERPDVGGRKKGWRWPKSVWLRERVGEQERG